MSSANDIVLGLNALVREARERANLTQQELAGHLGVSERSVQNWEAGTTFPRPSQRRALLAFIAEQGATA